ncbi:MAG: L,D-transpeptidase [Dinoroseobacter sp.]|nr:L,D-transpeptidase [Dinoroseobacter sp.]
MIAGVGSLGLTAMMPVSTRAQAVEPFVIPREYLPTRVRITEGFSPGTINVFTNYHLLYWIEPGDQKTAIRYIIGVGELGRQFNGSATIRRKEEWPSWTPTRNMIRRRPDLYAPHAGGMPGGPGNPLGSRALYLFRGGRDTLYRIHGTHAPHTVGSSISNGCIRLFNSHVEDLYERVPLGTRVIVHNDPLPSG